MTNILVHPDIHADSSLLIRNIPSLEFWTSETRLPIYKRSGCSADVSYSITQDKNTDYLEDITIYRLVYIHAFPRSIPDGNATSKVEINEELEVVLRNSITQTFDAAKDETFHDGFDSQFSESISRFILDFGIAAVLMIEKIMESPSTTLETTEETLRQIGKITDTRTHATRLALLLRELWSPNPRIRDAASLGIAYLDDPSAIPFLRRAVETEQSAWVRTNLALTLEQIAEGT